MKLYLLTQKDNTGYDTYDSSVVAAESADAARLIHPNEGGLEYYWSDVHQAWGWDMSDEKFHASYCGGTWATHPDKVDVKKIGRARKGTKTGVICSSFNAG